jgi:hypothetical protein
VALVVLVGNKKAVAIADWSLTKRQRWSKLREWLPLPWLSPKAWETTM